MATSLWWLVCRFSPLQISSSSLRSARTSFRMPAPSFTSRSKNLKSGSLMLSLDRLRSARL